MNRGKIVTTTLGKGRTYDREKMLQGKVIVYLLTDDLKHKTDDKGHPVKALVLPEKLTVIGFVD